MGLDNMFSAFCQIFLDKIKKMLSNKSSLIKYNPSFVNMHNRGREKNTKIKNSKILPFHSKILPFSFLTGVKNGGVDGLDHAKYYPQLQKLQFICSTTYY